MLSRLSTQPGWVRAAGSAAGCTEGSSASPRKVLGIAHRGAPPVPSIARLPQPATKPSNCSTFLSTE